MLIFYLLLFFTVSLGLHLILLPIFKKRPIVLEGIEATTFIILLIILITFFSNPYCYLLGLIIGLILLFIKYWLIIGIPKNYITDALNKAITVSRANIENNAAGYKIENAENINIYSLGKIFHVVIFKKISYSKKAELSINNWRKFIQNYYIKFN